jgi:hypothetical protein
VRRCWRRGSGWRRVSRVCAWFVIVSCGQFGVHGEAAHLPRKRGCLVEETRHSTTQAPPSAASTAFYGLDNRQCHSNGPILQVVRWLHAISWRLHITEARNGRGIKETAFKPPGKQSVGLLGAYILNLCQWHGAGRAKWSFLRCRFLATAAYHRQGTAGV